MSISYHTQATQGKILMSVIHILFQKRRRKTVESRLKEKQQRVIRKHPLSVILEITGKGESFPPELCILLVFFWFSSSSIFFFSSPSFFLTYFLLSFVVLPRLFLFPTSCSAFTPCLSFLFQKMPLVYHFPLPRAF